MERTPMNNDQIQGLLKTVSGKLGVQPDELKKALQNGKLDGAVKNMEASEKQKLESIIGNKEKLEKLMQSPQAKSLYEKLTGKSPQ